MKITLFKTFDDPYRESMTQYVSCLERALRRNLNGGESVRGFFPSFAVKSPKIARHFSQYVFYQAGAAFSQTDINHVIDPEPPPLQIPANNVKRDVGSRMADVSGAVNRGAANIHAHFALGKGPEDLWLPFEGVIELEHQSHDKKVDRQINKLGVHRPQVVGLQRNKNSENDVHG